MAFGGAGKLKGSAYPGKKVASDPLECDQLAAQNGERLELVFEELGGFR